MNSSAEYLSPSETAERLGISQKALRHYEQRGLLHPLRTSNGWRTYGPKEMERLFEIRALRALGLSLAHVRRVLAGEMQELEAILAAHQNRLESDARHMAETAGKVRAIRVDIAEGRKPAISELQSLVRPLSEPLAAFDLPWPWGGERFELRDVRALNYIIGPLGSGKTRLARAIAENLSGAAFLGLDRADNNAFEAQRRMEADADLRA